MTRMWVAVGAFSLFATLSQAADLPEPVTHATFPKIDMAKVLFGRSLFFDPILSGNRNIACATCHHPSLGSSDGVALSLGEGAVGLGPERRSGKEDAGRIPRNAPALWNIGAQEFTVLFHDGRVEIDPGAERGLRTPEDRPLPGPLPSVLAAQTLMPMLSPDEMAGQAGENDVADAVAAGNPQAAWALLAARVAAIPDYRARLGSPETPEQPDDIITIASALAAFIAFEFRATDSPFDAYLSGTADAMSTAALRGMDLFYGQAGCASCHSGLFQTDHGFHAIGVPQFGPGKSEDQTDPGRYLVTGKEEDRYRFRTPSLRNIALTAPYGHDGAFASLEATLRHHADPVSELMAYRSADIDGPDPMARIDLAAAIELPATPLSDGEIFDLLAFLAALTDSSSTQGRLGVPSSVPSGLPVDR